MADFLSSVLTSSLAKKAGVPQPTPLRRYEPGAPLCDSPVLVAGDGAVATDLRGWLPGQGLALVEASDVLAEAEADPGAARPRLGALVLDATTARTPADLSVLREVVGGALRRLGRNARVVLVGVDPAGLTDVAAAATQRALEGFSRSLAKELRAGATANLVLVPADGEVLAGARSAVTFFLSGRSAYVDGQVVRVGAGGSVEEAAPTRPLEGKVAVVTGAARGIGAEVARVLARDGATVVAVDVPAAGDGLAALANEVGGTALQLDVTAADAGTRIVEHATRRHGGIDIVVHNAGITRDKLLANMDEKRWDAVMSVNLESILAMNEAILGEGGLGDGGRIVCLASIAGIAGNRGQTNYGASKSGVIGLVQALAPQVRDRGITVNAVAPGFIETEMTAKIPFATREIGRRTNALQQGGLPRDVAETIAWLAQPGAAGITGQAVRVCGQMMLGA